MESIRVLQKTGWLVILSCVTLGLLVSGCGQQQKAGALEVWCHQGQEAENAAMREIAQAFNDAHQDRNLQVEITFFPDYQYTEKISAAAAAGDLPDAFDLDGPTVAQFVEAGLLATLDEWISPEERSDFLPTIVEQGTVDGQLYALGAFDSALVLYYDKSMLASADVEEPPESGEWPWAAFMDACEKLKQAGIEPLTMHMNESADEWYTYAFSPVIWSAGGRLISSDGSQVEGVMDADKNVEAVKQWQEVFEREYAATDPINPDPFGSGETAMDWTGHWMARRHQEAKGEHLGVTALPLPGDRQIAACGSWCWTISSDTGRPEDAAEWIRWVTDPTHGVKPIVAANGAVPARRSAFDMFPEFQKKPYSLFRELLIESGRPRPRTPYYATLTQRFAAALRDIAHGADVSERLGKAAGEVQRVLDRRMEGP